MSLEEVLPDGWVIEVQNQGIEVWAHPKGNRNTGIASIRDTEEEARNEVEYRIRSYMEFLEERNRSDAINA